MNYYQAVERKPEDGGGWVFMCINRRSGVHIACYCRFGLNHGWGEPGHAAAVEAEQCFYNYQLTRKVHVGHRLLAEGDRSPKCDRCHQFTDRELTAGNLLFSHVPLCEECAPEGDSKKTLESLRVARPFIPGINIIASW